MTLKGDNMRVRSRRLLIHFRSSQSLFLAMFFFAFILSATQTAKACSCGPRPPLLDSFEEAQEVVIVRVLSVRKVEKTDEQSNVDGVRSATMVVDKVFKGQLKVRDEIVFGQGNGADCIWTFNEESVGREYLFYLTRPETLTKSDRTYLPSKEPGLWFAFGCGRSTGLAGATEDLLYLENMSKRRGQTRISGTIGGGFQHPDIDVAGKKIKIIGEKKTYETKTDKNGVFEIYNLPPGKYAIEPELSAGWKIDPYWLRYSSSIVSSEFEQPKKKSVKQVEILLEPKKHASVEIVFDVDNTVRGRVIGPKGRPMDRVCVYLWPPGAEPWGSFDCTDEQGRFEITSVPKGEYVLVANRDGKLSSQEPFRRTFYPNVAERGRAAVI
ncbi:MAG TPA: carboxypeptidase-like regulatory domain-containing protein, partial [Pyrinomonadaceae bacterium]|nr:carboxypeptidase-like regulatory domain-containing protein [Pyrinomonadaceae bacterium]